MDYGWITTDYDPLRITGKLWVQTVQNGVRADFSRIGFNKNQYVDFRDQTTTVGNLRVHQKAKAFLATDPEIVLGSSN